MIAENNSFLTDASEMLYTLNSDEAERRLSQARLEYIIHEKAVNKRLSELDAATQTLTVENQTLTAKNQALTVENQTLIAEKQKMADTIERLKTQLADHEKK